MTQETLFGAAEKPIDWQTFTDEHVTDEIVIASAECGCILAASCVPLSTQTASMREHIRDVARWQKDKSLSVSTVNHKTDGPVVMGGCERCLPDRKVKA